MRSEHFRELTAEERSRMTSRDIDIWEARAMDLNPREVAAMLGITYSVVAKVCTQIRVAIGAPSTRGNFVRPERRGRRRLPNAAGLTTKEFEQKCEWETERELLLGTQMPGMKLQDFQRCEHCGLRGHLPEACDLPLVRAGIVEGRKGDMCSERGEA